MWKESLPDILPMKPSTDLCRTCQRNTQNLSIAANMPLEEKLQLIREAQEHVQHAANERAEYNCIKQLARVSMPSHCEVFKVYVEGLTCLCVSWEQSKKIKNSSIVVWSPPPPPPETNFSPSYYFMYNIPVCLPTPSPTPHPPFFLHLFSFCVLVCVIVARVCVFSVFQDAAQNKVGVVHARTACDAEAQTFQFLMGEEGTSANLPPVIKPQELSLQKQQYLDHESYILLWQSTKTCARFALALPQPLMHSLSLLHRCMLQPLPLDQIKHLEEWRRRKASSD